MMEKTTTKIATGMEETAVTQLPSMESLEQNISVIITVVVKIPTAMTTSVVAAYPVNVLSENQLLEPDFLWGILSS